MVRAYFLCDGLVDVNDENDNRELIHVIIQELASSSISFEGKTDFSKKKYLKKKSEKYIMRCMLVEANSQTVCEQQYMKLPVKLKSF